MRFGVDPDELHSAAGRVGEVADLAQQATERLSLCSPDAWCADRGLADAVEMALDTLRLLALSAQGRAASVSLAMTSAAQGYHDADTPRPR